MSNKFIELVSEFGGKYIVPIDSITTVYQEESNSTVTEVHYGKEEFVRAITPYDIIVNKLFED